MKKLFVFRNYTIEPLFNDFTGYKIEFGNYGSVHSCEFDSDIYFWFNQFPFHVLNNAVIKEVSSYVDDINYLLSKIPINKYIVIATITKFGDNELFLSDYAVIEEVNRFNRFLYDLTKEHKNVIIFDSESLNKNLKFSLIDWRYFYNSLLYFNPKNSRIIGLRLVNYFNSLLLPRKKCIALDLDNTLWGGVLGEDGPSGVLLSNNYPGSCYRDFQILLKAAKENGVILVLISKNNFDDVFHFFENNQNLILHWDDFASVRINWDSKASNIESIAKELNLGLDSFIFVDDSPFERNLMKEIHPEVEVPKFPVTREYLRDYFFEFYNKNFKKLSITLEDNFKTQQYLEEKKRSNLKNTIDDFNDYIKKLKIQLKIFPIDVDFLKRCSQMTQKTNQFNLRTIRYTELDLSEALQNGSYLYGLSVSDSFGDSGLTGLCILSFKNNLPFIDTFLLSCRILGRNIENEFLNTILNSLKEKGFFEVHAEFIPSLKNQQAENFYEKNGFKCKSVVNENKFYILELSSWVKSNSIIDDVHFTSY